MCKSSELHLLIIIAYYAVTCAPRTSIHLTVINTTASLPAPRSVMSWWELETDDDHGESVCTMEVGNHYNLSLQYLLMALL